MTKKEATTKLKGLFRDPNIATSKLKLVRDLYSQVKDLPQEDSQSIPKTLEVKISLL